MKGLDQEKVKQFGCELLMNTPSSSYMGGVWERQIRFIRSVLTAILDQSGKRQCFTQGLSVQSNGYNKQQTLENGTLE